MKVPRITGAYHHVKSMTSNQQLIISEIPTDNNLADCLTKHLKNDRFTILVEGIFNYIPFDKG